MVYDITAGWVIGAGPDKEAVIADALRSLRAEGIEMTRAEIDLLLSREDYRLVPEPDDEPEPSSAALA